MENKDPIKETPPPSPAPDTPVMDRQPWLFAGATWIALVDYLLRSTGSPSGYLPGPGPAWVSRERYVPLSALVAAGMLVTGGRIVQQPAKSSAGSSNTSNNPQL